MGGLVSHLALDRKSEKHGQASCRYSDLLSDAEEVLCKERRFRPRCDVTMQKFKMQSDSADRTAPPVDESAFLPQATSITDSADSETDA